MSIPDSMPKKTDLLPRNEIPDAWAKSGHCPACQAEALQAIHLGGAPDYLICGQCELSFEVEMEGRKIRLKNVPQELGFLEGELRYRWIEPYVIGQFLSNRLALKEQQAGISKSAYLSDEDVWNRATSLFRMGNQPKMIEFILIQAGATPAQAQAAFARLKERSEQDAKNQARKFWLAGGAIIFIAFALVAGWAATPHLVSAQVRGALTSPAGAATQPNMLLPLFTNLPFAIRPAFLKSPAQMKSNDGPARAQCPTLPSHAAVLFGGYAIYWTPINQTDGWQMMSTDAPSTIRIPAGMYAAFADNRTGAVSTTTGPITISNIHFIAIRCN